MVRPSNPESAAALGTRLAELNQIGVALSQEKNLDRLLETILLAAKKITNADGGTLYRHPPGQDTLTFEIIRTDSLGIAMGGMVFFHERFALHEAIGAALILGGTAFTATVVNAGGSWQFDPRQRLRWGKKSDTAAPPRHSPASPPAQTPYDCPHPIGISRARAPCPTRKSRQTDTP